MLYDFLEFFGYFEAGQKRFPNTYGLSGFAASTLRFCENEYLTPSRLWLHSHPGFGRIGVFRKSGYKFGRRYGMIGMEKTIGKHRPEKPPVKNFAEGNI